jgi:hypothetical protein
VPAGPGYVGLCGFVGLRRGYPVRPPSLPLNEWAAAMGYESVLAWMGMASAVCKVPPVVTPHKTGLRRGLCALGKAAPGPATQ